MEMKIYGAGLMAIDFFGGGGKRWTVEMASN